MDYYRFFPVKYREKTLALDPYQDGCYRRLIDEYMEHRLPLPNNEAALARICSISLNEWKDHACSMLVAYFEHSNGMLFNKTCDEELAFQDAKSKFQSDKAKKAAKVRWNKNNKLDATSMPVAMLGDAIEESRELRVESKESKEAAATAFDVINLFDESLCSVWGENYRRLCPVSKDKMIAENWLSHGITIDFCRAYFPVQLSALKKRNVPIPKGLSFFNSTIAQDFAANEDAKKPKKRSFAEMGIL